MAVHTVGHMLPEVLGLWCRSCCQAVEPVCQLPGRQPILTAFVPDSQCGLDQASRPWVLSHCISGKAPVHVCASPEITILVVYTRGIGLGCGLLRFGGQGAACLGVPRRALDREQRSRRGTAPKADSPSKRTWAERDGESGLLEENGS